MRWIRTHWFLIGIFAVGAMVRLINLNWDAGGRLHPDEALIVNGALSLRIPTQWNPFFHDYNGFSVYLLKVIAPFVSSPETLTIIGRFISALLSTVSVLLIYFLGKKWWNERVGTYAAILLATTPLFIQLAHFYTTESIMVLLLLTMLLVAPSPMAMAVPMGLLLATKNTAYLILPIPTALLATATFPRLNRTALSIALFFLLGSIVFFLGSPYSFLDLPGYLERSRYLTGVVSGKLLMDWTMQFQDTTGWFWIPSLAYASGLTPFLGFIGIVAVLTARAKRNRSRVIISLWSIGFLIFLGVTYLKFTRYAAPVLPLLLLFAAKTLTDLRNTALRYPSFALIILHVVYGLMFSSIYFVPHTSLAASRWIAKHIPKKSSILVEEWNSIIRFSRPELTEQAYRIASVNFYAPESETKKKLLQATLNTSDYVILESPKVRRTIMRLREKYPYTATVYEQLDNGRLGFTEVARFTSYPRLGPFMINDEGAEETFTVFDHPTVTIYRKETRNSEINGVP